MKKQTLISQDFLAGAKKAHDEYIKNYDVKILDRITYIIETYVNLWGNKLSTWYFEDANESEVGDFWTHHDDQWISNLLIEDRFIYEAKSKFQAQHEYILYDKNNKVIDICSRFPIRWLWEDFEQELIDGKAKYEEQQLAKASSKQQKTQKLINSAKAKLTKEELIALTQNK